MKYKYKARNQAGALQEGMVEASTTSNASTLLQRHNLVVVSLEPQKEKNPLESLSRLWEGVSGKEFVIFSRQMAVMVEAKVPLLSALQGIIEQTENPYFAGILSAVLADVDEGKSFSEACAGIRKFFPISMSIWSSQEKFPEIFSNRSKIWPTTSKKIIFSPRKSKGVLYYPAFILTAFFTVGFLMITFVIPKLTEMLKETNAKLPITTKNAHLDGRFHAALLVGGADRHHCGDRGTCLLYPDG